jgi:hypothetical protein
MDVNSLTPTYFDWAVKHMADMAIRLATNPRPQERELHWSSFLTAGRRDPTHVASPVEASTAP